MNVLIGIHKNLSFLMYSHMFINKLTFFTPCLFLFQIFSTSVNGTTSYQWFIEFVLHIIKSLLIVEKE